MELHSQDLNTASKNPHLCLVFCQVIHLGGTSSQDKESSTCTRPFACARLAPPLLRVPADEGSILKVGGSLAIDCESSPRSVQQSLDFPCVLFDLVEKQGTSLAMWKSKVGSTSLLMLLRAVCLLGEKEVRQGVVFRMQKCVIFKVEERGSFVLLTAVVRK